jgi:hypothetical protein
LENITESELSRLRIRRNAETKKPEVSCYLTAMEHFLKVLKIMDIHVTYEHRGISSQVFKMYFMVNIIPLTERRSKGWKLVPVRSEYGCTTGSV